MTTMLALVLMINGVQVELPAPAYLIGDHAFVPARAVFEQLGWQVTWDAQAKSLTLATPGGLSSLLTLDQTQVSLPGGTAALPAAPRMIGNLLYVPVRAVTTITGAQATWDAQALAVNLLTMPVGEPTVAELGQILADPPAWAGKLVLVTGEYLGWQSDPFGPATRHGPPVTRSDWTLRDASGCLYCAAGPGAPAGLRPLEDLGRRLTVIGVVALADRGFPYLQPTTVTLLTGLAGVTCYLRTGRLSYQPGQTVTMQMEVANPGPEDVTLHFTSGQTYEFQVLDPEGQLLWAWSQGKVFTMALQERELKAGERYAVSAEWTVPADLPPGLYRVRGIINREVSSYPVTIAVEKS